MKEEKIVAVLTIYSASTMSAKGKRDIDNWLNEQGKSLMKEGKNYPPRFRAKYLYVPNKDDHKLV